jgi:nucleotidyltransferase substrate binding protein (TIGR01987 family)
MSDIPVLVEDINITPLLKARNIIEQFSQHTDTDQEKAGLIQAFEFCFELSWKTMKRILEKQGIEVNSPKNTFREAAKTNMIADPKIWFRFIEQRNLTVHTYDLSKADLIVTAIPEFKRELNTFINNILPK